jgi:hypothetical protein
MRSASLRRLNAAIPPRAGKSDSKGPIGTGLEPLRVKSSLLIIFHQRHPTISPTMNRNLPLGRCSS